MTLQQKIIQEIVAEQRTDPAVIAIVVFGSASVGEERESSDVDIEIISTSATEYSLDQQERYGVSVDFEIIPKEKLLLWVNEYPYLWYDYMLRNRVEYDPEGIISKALNRLRAYFKKRPDVCRFWEEKLSLMKRAKKEGRKPENCYRVYDEAERKFSTVKKVTRDFFRD